MTPPEGYLLDNRSVQAGERFDALSAIFNPSTFRHIETLGIEPGWHCWEVGAGGTSVPRWLAEQVGPDGHVLATDIDVSWAQEAAGPNVEVRQHDVAIDELPTGPFDLIHARLVLVHVPGRERALRSMVDVLRPGGWLIVEDGDPALQPLSALEERGPDEELANRVRRGFRALLSERGADLEWGRKLPRLLRETGLSDVAADAYMGVALPACGLLETANVNQIRDALIAHELVTADEIDRHLSNVAAGRLDPVTPTLISAWGRRA